MSDNFGSERFLFLEAQYIQKLQAGLGQTEYSMPDPELFSFLSSKQPFSLA